MNEANGLSLPLDCCLTGVAVAALTAQAGYYFAKNSAYEGWLTCEIGWQQAGRVVNHIAIGASRLLGEVSVIASRFLGEIGHLFPVTAGETERSFVAAGRAMERTVECLSWALCPLHEVGAVCQSGVLATQRALEGFWRGSVRSAETLYAMSAPFGFEAYEMVLSSVNGRVSGALSSACRSGADIVKATVGGLASELTGLFVTALEQTNKTAATAQESSKSLLKMSEESSYRLLLEAADTCEIGFHECLKAYAAAPAAVRAFVSLPTIGAAALLMECYHSCLEGANESQRSFVSLQQQANEVIDLLKATLVAQLRESAHTVAEGAAMSDKSFIALIHAIDHGTEQLRSTLLALISEGAAALMSGARSTPQAMQAAETALSRAGDMILPPSLALLEEGVAAITAGVDSTPKAFNTAIESISSTLQPACELTYRTAMEGGVTLEQVTEQAEKTLLTTARGVENAAAILGELPLAVADEALAAGYKAPEEANRLTYEMTHDIKRRLNVHIYYPLQQTFYPRMQAVKKAWEKSMNRLNVLMGF